MVGVRVGVVVQLCVQLRWHGDDVTLFQFRDNVRRRFEIIREIQGDQVAAFHFPDVFRFFYFVGCGGGYRG